MLNLLVSLVSGTFQTWLKDKQETDKLKTLAKIENSKGHLLGYSDEFLILVWSYPFIACFVPYLYPSAVKGFERLSTMPDWYIGGFISITFAVFGIDKLFRWKK